MRVVVRNHVLFEFRDDVTESDTIDVDIHRYVGANIVHGANVDLLLAKNKVLPDVKVLVNDELLVLLPTKEESVEVCITSSILCLYVVPPTPNIMVVPFE